MNGPDRPLMLSDMPALAAQIAYLVTREKEAIFDARHIVKTGISAHYAAEYERDKRIAREAKKAAKGAKS